MIMKHQVLLIILILLSISSESFSQKTFIYSEKDSLNDDAFLDATELPNGNFILIGSKVQFENDSTTIDNIIVTKLNAGGVLITKKTFNYGGYKSLVNSVIQINPNLI